MLGQTKNPIGPAAAAWCAFYKSDSGKCQGYCRSMSYFSWTCSCPIITTAQTRSQHNVWNIALAPGLPEFTLDFSNPLETDQQPPHSINVFFCARRKLFNPWNNCTLRWWRKVMILCGNTLYPAGSMPFDEIVWYTFVALEPSRKFSLGQLMCRRWTKHNKVW